MSDRRTAAKRKVIRRACDACKIRKIKCSEHPPCDGCMAARIPCTFKKTPSSRGPRKLRQKTIEQISQRQKQYADINDLDNRACSSHDAGSTQSPCNADTGIAQGPVSDPTSVTSLASLVPALCIYGLRLFPIWPIVEVEDIIAALQLDDGNIEIYALANAVGAATMAQLKLESSSETATASSMEAECQRTKSLDKGGRHATLNTLRIAFFLHVYHENQDAGGVQSLLYMREAITLAQIMGLHRDSTYAALPSMEQEIRKRIIWLLLITERGVAMLHNLPIALRCNARFPSTDRNDGSQILPAFRNLNTEGDSLSFNGPNLRRQNLIDILQHKLQEVPIDWELSNDVQRADICATRQWMRAVLWKASLSHNSDQVPSLSHPIQSPEEFLAVISKLPTTAIEAHGPSIEFKIFEIASAVTDAIASSLRGWRGSDNARDILGQLHKILTSCRGCNITLASMLCVKIAQIQDRQPLLLGPSPRIQELSDQWIDQMRTPGGFNIEIENSFRPNSSLGLLAGSLEDRESTQDEAQRGAQNMPSWGSSVGEELVSSIVDSTDLFQQLQNFSGSFENVEFSDSLDLFRHTIAPREGLPGMDFRPCHFSIPFSCNRF